MKVLCLGNNTEDTDIQTRKLCDTICHGLLSEVDRRLEPQEYSHSGWYHSSVYDIDYGRLLEIAKSFDQVLMVDQSLNQWSHPDAFYKTVRLVKELSNGKFLNQSFQTDIVFFENLVDTNPSFCIFPFIELLVDNNHTTVCCRSSTPITNLQDLEDFQTNPSYQKIRSKMLAGHLIPEHCTSCYDLESRGLPSARKQETVEWANRLGLSNLEDLKALSKPSYYEVRASNKCNLQCRMCSPENSHLVDKEYRQIGLVPLDAPLPKKNSTGFDIVEFENLKKLYVAGGEPTVMVEFYEFLDRLIKEKQTHHEILVNTNGTKLSERFKKQLKNFSNFQFVFSIDGIDSLNYYIRWPSDWNKIVSNWKYLRDHNHHVTVNTTVSIYNISRLYDIFSYIDQHFPGTLIHVALTCSSGDILSPFHYPDSAVVIRQLEKIKNLDCYANDRLFSNSIDGYIEIFKNRRDEPDLSEFFKFNDLLDQSRGINLGDYHPELEQYRPV